MNVDENFKLTVDLPELGEITLAISHPDETFTTKLTGKTVSLINNGDNSWSLVEGENISQETVNLIGDAIEKHYRSQL